MKRVGVLTSGGDAPGMNAAVRAVVRTALDRGAETFAIYDGYQGMYEGGDKIRPIDWRNVGGILNKGGTIIGTARCDIFRTRPGRSQAVYNLLTQGIDRLAVIGGDGSLTGANLLRQEWPELVAELVENGRIHPEMAEKHSQLTVVGLPGSIDNDIYGTDITIGADTALKRITDAIDAITSTAASHQRTFVVEVMGRRCGYLAMMGAIASGADWALIPESPPNLDNWEDKMCEVLRKGRQNGRRDSIVVVAEGAQDRKGNPITSSYLRQVLEDKMGEDTRVTILGHVQRGGAPTCFDRNLSTILGSAAVDVLLSESYTGQGHLMGLRGNRPTLTPLDECLQQTKAIGEALKNCDFDTAMNLRGNGFKEAFQTLRTLVRSLPRDPEPGQRRLRMGVLNAGAPAPGMNTAVRAVVRLGLDRGHIMMGISNGIRGLIEGSIEEFNWMSVNGWAHVGGSELGSNRHLPEGSDFYAIARNIEEHGLQGLVVIGGWSAYQAALQLHEQRHIFPAFNIPIVCVPATIDNDLPGAELSIGADTALNNIMEAVDKIKQSAVASRRVFVVEVMGNKCGYLALMSAIATGAERVYLHEEGVTLKDLERDVTQLIRGFKQGKPLGLVIRSEGANETYTTDFIKALFEEEGRHLFNVRKAVLGHLQQGGDPTPFDRILATRFAAKSIAHLEEQIEQPEPRSVCLGQVGGLFSYTNLEDVPRMIDKKNGRPKKQWWLSLRGMARILAQPGSTITAE
ncbi:MAG: 6-phosphofructokinase [Anaerolineales bacterium]|nr:6-phosphofructokinase [Anaerolineales bacterium]